MKYVRLPAWIVCAVLVLGSVAWAQTSGRTAEQDDVFWESVSGCTDAVEVEMYLDAFSGGQHVAEARACLEKLGKAVPASGKKTPSTEVERLLEVCAMHFAADRLTTGVGGAAVGCYREVQSLDPANKEALEGLRRVFDKYASWAQAALERGDVGDARVYVGKLKKLNPESPQAKEFEREIARLEKEAAEARERAEAERKERERVERERREREERERAALAPGRVFRDCDACPEMVVVPAGSFMMGSPSHEEGRNDDEGPVHRVTIPAPFAVGRYEVTRGEFARFVEAAGHSTGNSCWTYEDGDWKDRSGLNWRNPGYRQDNREPVVCVNWEDARAYVNWLSRETGKPYRLLSEAEWEYSARAGTTGPFHFGATISTDQANYDGNYIYGSGREGVYRKKTVPVGSFPANGFGLHAVHGNVWEWVEDCWHASYRGAPSDGSVWVTGGDCGYRVLRGGSWYDDPRILRSAIRGWNAAGTVATTAASVSPGRSPHESLPPYLRGPGAQPLANLFSRRQQWRAAGRLTSG